MSEATAEVRSDAQLDFHQCKRLTDWLRFKSTAVCDSQIGCIFLCAAHSLAARGIFQSKKIEIPATVDYECCRSDMMIMFVKGPGDTRQSVY